MSDNATGVVKRLRHLGLAGVMLGVLALIACELPVVLVLVGLGAGALAVQPHPWFEVAGVVSGVIGVALLTGLLIHRLWHRGENSQS